MKTLILCRHGKAEKTGYEEDFQRKLVTRGWNDLRLMGERLKQLAHTPNLILSSNAVRTRESTTALLQALAPAQPEIDYRTALYLASSTELLQELRSLEANPEILMLVGHNPGISDLAYQLCGQLLESLPTAGICILNTPIENWNELRYASCNMLEYWRPKDYR